MGYRSQVKIVVSKEGFGKLKEYVEKESLKVRKPDSDYSYNLLEHADSIRPDEPDPDALDEFIKNGLVCVYIGE